MEMHLTIQISGSVKLHIGDSRGKPEMHKCRHINVLSVAMHKEMAAIFQFFHNG